LKILFVDDDQGLLDQAKYVLEKENDERQNQKDTRPTEQK